MKNVIKFGAKRQIFYITNEYSLISLILKSVDIRNMDIFSNTMQLLSSLRESNIYVLHFIVSVSVCPYL